MSISKVNFSSAGLPITAADYTALEKSILSLVSGFDGVILTAWDDKTTTPKITQSVYIRHAGNTYQVTGADETITGTLSAGNNYVKLTGTGSTLTASYVTSLSGYTFNPVYNGWYNGSDQILTEFVVLDGSDIINTKNISRYEFDKNIDQDGLLRAIGDVEISNDLTVSNDLQVNGNIYQTEQYFGEVDLTQNAFFDRFSGIVPNVGDIATINGFVYEVALLGPAIATYHMIKRDSTSTLLLAGFYHFMTGAMTLNPVEFQITNGSTSFVGAAAPSPTTSTSYFGALGAGK